MSYGRGEREPPPPLYSVLPQPIYTPPENHNQHRLYEPRYQQRRYESDNQGRQQADYEQYPDFYDRYPSNERLLQTPVFDYYQYNPYGEVDYYREAYRDPQFDYQKSTRYEAREQYPWDQPRAQQQGYYRDDGYQPSPRRVVDDYLWFSHDGRDAQRGQPQARYPVPVENHPLADQQRDDWRETGGYDTLKPAGLANKYDVKITDLLTSIMDKSAPEMTVQQMMEENKGYLVLCRFNRSEMPTVVNAFQCTKGILSASYEGYVIGFAEPQDITVSSLSNDSRAHTDSWFLGPRYAACCLWFKHAKRAKEFFEGVNPFKQHDFPSSDKIQVIAVPLTYGRNPEPLPFDPETRETTLLWSEFPTISERGPSDFLYNYSEPVRQLIREYGGHPNVTICKVKLAWPQDLNKFGQERYRMTNVHVERVGRNIRNGWLTPDSFVTVSAFRSREQLFRLFADPRFAEKRTMLQRYTGPTMLGITLRKVRGTGAENFPN